MGKPNATTATVAATQAAAIAHKGAQQAVGAAVGAAVAAAVVQHNVPSAGKLAAQPVAPKAAYALTGATGRNRSQKLAYNRTLPLVRVPGAAVGAMLQGYMANVAKVWVAGNTGNQLQTALNALPGVNGGRHVRRLMRAGALVLA